VVDGLPRAHASIHGNALGAATGTSAYTDVPGGRVTRVFDNCFVMHFDDEGRCREFTAYYTKRPDPAA
jgi:hypothetical protein